MCRWRCDHHDISAPVPDRESFKDVMVDEAAVLSTRLGAIPVLFINSKPLVLLIRRQCADGFENDGAFQCHGVSAEKSERCEESEGSEQSGALTPGAIMCSFLEVAQAVSTGASRNPNRPIGVVLFDRMTSRWQARSPVR